MTQGFFEQFLIILCAAVVLITLFQRLHIPQILAYLVTGMAVGPFAFGVVADPDSMSLLSELGVVFLLFMLGLEFSLPKMLTMRKTVFGLGSLQVIATSLAIVGISMLLGLPLAASIVIAGALALSSTAIVTRELIQRNELVASHGQLSFGVLLFQDLAAVFFLIVVPTLGDHNNEMNGTGLLIFLLEGAGLLLFLMVFGRTLLPLLFHEVARSKSDELFVLTTLVAALIAAWVTHAAGLSMALGGFLAGMMMGESHYRHQLESDIRPFRDLLLGLFFVSVGMQLDLMALMNQLHWVLLCCIGLILIKTSLITGLATLMHKNPANALRAGICLCQGGEFGFALLALALSNSLIDPQLNTLIVSTIILSMAVTPLLIRYSGKISSLFFPVRQVEVVGLPTPDKVDEKDPHFHNHVIICGFGRVGQIIARFLDQIKIRYAVIDSDPVRVQEAAAAGVHIYYGDARRADLVASLGAANARLLILTFPDHQQSLSSLKSLKHRFDALPILVRTRDDSNLEPLQLAGAAEVVPESLEGSLMLVSHVLAMLRVPKQVIEQKIDAVRAERYQLLHGYLHGGQSTKVDAVGELREVLHPVTLNEESFAHSQTLSALRGIGLTTVIDSVRRGDRLIEKPADNFECQAGDILLLHGTADQMAIAEGLIQSGRLIY